VTSAFPQLGGGLGENWAGKRLTGILGAGTGRLHASAMSGAIWLLARPVDDDDFDGDSTPEAPEGNGVER